MSFAYTQGVVVLERFCTPFISLTQTKSPPPTIYTEPFQIVQKSALQQ